MPNPYIKYLRLHWNYDHKMQPNNQFIGYEFSSKFILKIIDYQKP